MARTFADIEAKITSVSEQKARLIQTRADILEQRIDYLLDSGIFTTDTDNTIRVSLDYVIPRADAPDISAEVESRYIAAGWSSVIIDFEGSVRYITARLYR